MDKVTQPSANPTNKLTAAVWASMILGVGGLAVRNLAPSWYDPDVWVTLTPFAVFVAGWFVKDQANVVVVQSS